MKKTARWPFFAGDAEPDGDLRSLARAEVVGRPQHALHPDDGGLLRRLDELHRRRARPLHDPAKTNPERRESRSTSVVAMTPPAEPVIPQASNRTSWLTDAAACRRCHRAGGSSSVRVATVSGWPGPARISTPFA